MRYPIVTPTSSIPSACGAAPVFLLAYPAVANLRRAKLTPQLTKLY
jgi:hypothetical protein